VKELLLIDVVALVTVGVTAIAPPESREVDVVGIDYAFQVPRELPAGPTTFSFRNNGKKRHEFNIFLLKPGVSVTQVLELQKAGKSAQPLVEGPVGVLFAEPGGKSAAGLSAHLLAGRDYAVICIFRDTANAPRHYEMGMYSVIHVLPGKKSPASVAARLADTIVGSDYAFRYSKTLAPGTHTFVFRNEGKVRHEFNMVLLKPGITLERVLEVEKTKGDIDALFDDGIGVLWSRAGEMPFGRLEVDLLPGREYLIECGFSDDDKSPPHYTLGMYGSIVVSGKPAS